MLLLEYDTPHLDAFHWRESYVVVRKQLCWSLHMIGSRFTIAVLHDFYLFNVFIIF